MGMQSRYLPGNVDHNRFIGFAGGFGNGRRTEFKHKNGFCHATKVAFCLFAADCLPPPALAGGQNTAGGN
jgi:hypothetical protein